MKSNVSLYNADIFLWSETQGALLKRRDTNGLDWENLAEEISDVGRSQLHAVESHIVMALLHDLKVEAWPLSRDIDHWLAESRGHRADARRHYTPSMQRRIDIEKLYREALYRMPATIYDTLPLPVPETCPITLIDIIEAEEF